jgi:hypothetical protein
MITVFAVVSCLYVNGKVEIVHGVENCRVVPTHPSFSTFEACEEYRAARFKDTGVNSSGQEMKFSCWHKEIATWQR